MLAPLIYIKGDFMNKNFISMILYFAAAAFLFSYAFTSVSICLYAGIACLGLALVFSKVIKK